MLQGGITNAKVALLCTVRTGVELDILEGRHNILESFMYY